MADPFNFPLISLWWVPSPAGGVTSAGAAAGGGGVRGRGESESWREQLASGGAIAVPSTDHAVHGARSGEPSAHSCCCETDLSLQPCT